MKRGRTLLSVASLVAWALFAGFLTTMPAAPAIAAPYAYVVGGAFSGGADNIAVIDANPTSPTFNTVIATVPNTFLAMNLAITPDGSRGYVINRDGTLSVLDTNPSSPTFNTVLATITPPYSSPFTSAATAIAITPSGSRAYAGTRSDSSGDSFNGDSFDSVIDTVPTSSTYNTVLATIDTGFQDNTQAIAITPDGSRAYLTGLFTTVSCGSSAPPCTITTSTGQTVTCDGQSCAVAAIEVVDTATNTIDPTLTLTTPSGCGTAAIAITPDGSRAYVEDSYTAFTNGYICVSQLDVVNLATNTIVATIPIPGNATGGHPNSSGGPIGLAIAPDGNHAYVSAFNQTDGLVQVFDTNPNSATYNTLVKTIDLGPLTGSETSGIAITPDGSLVYLATENSGGIVGPEFGIIDVISTATNTVTATITLASATQPTAIAITPVAAYSGGQLAGPKKADFGDVAVGNSATRRITIANGSTTQALQVDVAAPTPNPPYTLVSGGGIATIGPNQSEQVIVQFTPTAASSTAVTGTLAITTSDPGTPSASVALTGRGR